MANNRLELGIVRHRTLNYMLPRGELSDRHRTRGARRVSKAYNDIIAMYGLDKDHVREKTTEKIGQLKLANTVYRSYCLPDSATEEERDRVFCNFLAK